MSKNDMVMVPRELAEAILGNAAQGYFSKDHGDALRGALKAQQHQGEPVALPDRDTMRRAYTACKYHAPHIFEAGWNSYHDEIAKLGPLYTHPVKGEPVAWTWQGSLDTLRGYCPAGVAVFPHKSPGTPIPLYTHPAAADHDEVERLRADLAQMTTFRDNAANHMRRIRAEATAFEKERDTLRAQLDERDHQLGLIGTCLGEILVAAKHIRAGVGLTGPQLLQFGEELRDCLSASAEPSAPVEIDERARFEKAVIDKAERFHPNLEQYGEHPEAEYRDPKIEWAWGLWQARAALERKP